MRKLFVGLAVAGLLAAGCGGDDGDTAADDPGIEGSDTSVADDTGGEASGSDDGGGNATGETLQLAASGFAWEPENLEAPAGETVSITVTNEDSSAHTFTSEAAGVDEEIGGGEEITVEVEVPADGSLEFFCEIHPSMQGTING